MANTLETLADILSLLAAHGVSCDIAGWAEELSELRPPWQHQDIDLIYQAQDFLRLDRVMADLEGVLRPVPAKHFPHKRAFTFRDTVV